MAVGERLLFIVGVALYWLRLHRAVIWLTRRIPKVVLYHAVAPEEEDTIRGIAANVPPQCFARHLDFYARYYNVVSVDRMGSAAVPDRALAITFDDGYRSVSQYALPELVARHLPATVYVVPGVTGNRRMIWVNELNWLARRHPIEARRAFREVFGVDDANFRDAPAMIDYVRTHYATDRAQRLVAAIHRALGSSSEQLAQAQRLYMDRDEVASLAAGGVTVGNHTWSHPSVPRLPEGEQQVEIARAAAELRSLPHWIPSFAFPFGDCDATGRDAAVREGHRTVCEVGGVNAPLRLDRIARVPVGPHSPAGLFAELEVVATVKGWVKRALERPRSRDARAMP